MKKTQVALAALALMASTAALAEVKLSGGLDTSLVKTDAPTVMTGGGNWNIPFVNITASEDLGGGLKATAVLEGSFTSTSGQTANGGPTGTSTSLFNRQANLTVGTSDFSITAGMQISPFITATLTGVAAAAPGNGVFVPALLRITGGNLANVDGTVASGGFWIPEAISATANVQGVTISALTRAKNSGGTAYSAAGITGSFGNINWGYGYQKYGDTSTLAGSQLTGSTDIFLSTAGLTNHSLSGNTKLGDVTLGVSVAQSRGPLSSTGYSIGAYTPIVGGLSGGLTYAANNADVMSDQTSLSLKYDFSKATYVYFIHNNFSDTNSLLVGNSAPIAPSKKATYVGIGTSF